ncbi:dynein regulatory complex protein 8 [Eretmochelys imbricata]
MAEEKEGAAAASNHCQEKVTSVISLNEVIMLMIPQLRAFYLLSIHQQIRLWVVSVSVHVEAATMLLKLYLSQGGAAAQAVIADIQKKITDAFEVFDHECNKTVDVREIGTIIRSLGCCPSEGELHDLLAEVEEEEPTGYIRLEKFLPMMTKVLMERRYRPIPEDVLLRAFEVLDANKCGHLTKEELVKYMTEEGEPFTQEEMEEMLSAAVDPETNTVRYRDYITMMVVDEN